MTLERREVRQWEGLYAALAVLGTAAGEGTDSGVVAVALGVAL